MPEQPQHLARKLLRSRTFGVLSTHSSDVPGYPFGSITPYVPDAQGRPMILISTLAQHTKNIRKDPKVCLTVWEDTEHPDPQTVGRLSWMGDAVLIEDQGQAKQRYLSYQPTSARHFEMHDFSLYRIELTRARYIGGFGAIFWVANEQMLPANPLAEHEAGILKHMNDDHAAALVKYVKAFKGRDAKEARMAGIDPEGFDVVADGHRLRFDLDPPATTQDDVRKAMIRLTRDASGPS